MDESEDELTKYLVDYGEKVNLKETWHDIQIVVNVELIFDEKLNLKR